MTRLSTLLATLFVVGEASAAALVIVPDTLAQRLVACSACHGKQGEGVRRNGYYPRIGGKPADYLYHQLTNFRDGKRGFPQMVYFVRHLSDAYLREIASYYSGLHPPYPPPAPAASAALMAHGDALVHDGDRTRAIPACVACHGDALTGTLPAIPALVGLFPDYITSQLESWQRGIRHAVAPDCVEAQRTGHRRARCVACGAAGANRHVCVAAEPRVAARLRQPARHAGYGGGSGAVARRVSRAHRRLRRLPYRARWRAVRRRRRDADILRHVLHAEPVSYTHLRAPRDR